MKDALTASRMNSLMSCPRKHYYAYELGLRAKDSSDALAFGSAWHNCMEARWNGEATESALHHADAYNPADPARRYVLRALFRAYCEVYADDPLRSAYDVKSEQEFALPLSGSRTFEVRGKLDGIAIPADGTAPIIIEHKTCGESVEPTSDYWTRLTYNAQLLQYVLAARACGFDVSEVIYDVARKPLLKVKANETFDAYEERLYADILSRPGFYFARQTVRILDEDLEEFAAMREEIAKQILYFRSQQRKAVAKGRIPESGWVRACTAINCRGCEYAGFCLSRISVDPANPPAGFVCAGQTPELSNK